MSATRLKVTVIGEGPDLVLLHGLAMHSGVFARMADDLSKNYRLNLVDLPGHGINHELLLPTDTRELAAQISAQVPPAAWLGWSLGGLIALQAAVDRNTEVKQLILLAATPAFVRTDNWPLGMDADLYLRFATGMKTDSKATLQRFLALVVGGSKNLRFQVRRLRSALANAPLPHLQTLLNGLDILRKTDLSSHLLQLDLPVLLIGGERDQLIAPAAMQEASEWLPNARLHMLPETGHTLFIGQRQQVVSQIDAFLKRDKHG